MVYCDINEVISEAKIKPKFFGLTTDEELENRVTKWAEQAQSWINQYTNTEFPDYPDAELPRLVTLASEEIIHNIIANRRVRQDGQYIKTNDWTLQTVPTSIFTDEIKGMLAPFVEMQPDYNNAEVEFFAVTGQPPHRRHHHCIECDERW